jgi:hypothetical protein
MTEAKRILRRWLRIDGLETPENDTVVRFALVISFVAVLLRFFFWAYTGRNWEDALITVLHSENLVNGLGLTHYLGEGERPLHGFTSPLSVLVPLLGDLMKVGFGLSFIKIVSALAGGLTVLYAMAVSIHPKIKLPTPLAVMIMGYLAVEHHQILWGMAGMETQMVVLVLLASLYFAVAEKTVPLGISLGFCMLARPDFAFWTAIVGLFLLIFHPRKLVAVAMIALAVYLPWIIFTTWYYGSPLPNTILAKEFGYPKWTTWPQFDRTPSYVFRMIWSAVTGSYGHYAVFQPLGPSFAGHGTSHRAVFNDGGLICDFMILMAVTGTVSILRKRQWAYLPVLLFVPLYAVYYVLFVACVFSWYLAPFVAMTLFLSARGMQTVGALLRPSGMRAGVWGLLAAVYLSIFVVLLPHTFSAEKKIQERVENNVRRQVGLFLGRVMEKNEVVGTEPLGYVGYYSRRIVYDWPGLCSRKVVEFSGGHPRDQRSLMGMLEFFQPEFIVLRYCEYQNSALDTWIDDNYRIIRSFEVPYDRHDRLFDSTNVDTGFFVLARKTWHPGVTEYGGEHIGIDPNHARALNSQGFRLMKQGKFEKATELINRSIAVAPDFPDAHNSLGLILNSQGNQSAALAQFRRALELDPDYALAHNNLGAVLAGQGDYDGAVGQLCEAMRCDAEYAEPHVNLANLLASRGNLAEARPHFAAALRVEPGNRAAAEGIRKIDAALGR